MKTILEMKNITKSFIGVRALKDINFSLESGEVRALMGENGAGKSTLIKVLTGVHKLDSGEIYLDNKRIYPSSTLDAQRIGISSVYQEVNLCDNLTVAENIMIGREPKKFGLIDKKKLIDMAFEAINKLSLNIDVRKPLSDYSLGIQQMIAITRSLQLNSKILILDEPTSSLEENEVNQLFEIIEKLKNSGIGIIFVTHFLDQVYRISDSITVLRNGALVGNHKTSELSKLDLIKEMLGKEYQDIQNNANKKQFDNEEEFIKIDGIGKKTYMHPVSFNIHKGEIVGFSGLLGSGRSETAKLIFGAVKKDSGNIFIKGNKKEFLHPIDAINNKIGFCSEDRKLEGIISDLSIRENIILALQAKNGIMKYISRKKQEQLANIYIKALNIVTVDSNKPIKFLSGGNQQKVLLARWLCTTPELLILDEPTRGIDIGSKSEIQKMMLDLSKEGMSFIFISSEMEEVIRTSDKVIIFKDNKKIKELIGNDINEKSILNSIAQEK